MAIQDYTGAELDKSNVWFMKDSYGREKAVCPSCRAYIYMEFYVAQPLVFRQIVHKLDCALQMEVVPTQREFVEKWLDNPDRFERKGRVL